MTRSEKKLLALGFSTELIQKCKEKNLTYSGLKGLSQKALVKYGFSESEAAIITSKTRREPIATEVLDSLLDKCGGVCCYCADGNHARVYQVHHMEEYHLTMDNKEGNLMVACPTHHVTIHTNNISLIDQRIKKKQWEQLWSIAKLYRDKGLDFPFSAFESVNYDTPGTITEIFAFGSPRPAICKQITPSALVEETTQILQSEHRLILSGASGSGKTTIAKAAAGYLTGYNVFTYMPATDPRKSIQEVATFLAMAVQPVILMIDNANASLSPDEIEKILYYSAPDKKIIIITTETGPSGHSLLEQHFVNAFMPVHWSALKAGIKKILLAHEYEIITYIRQNNADVDFDFPVGMGHLNTNLERMIDMYGREVKTVWEFIYMFSLGQFRLDKLHVDLVSRDRLDLVVLFIAIHQIADMEAGSTTEDILALYSSHPAFGGKPQPEKNWLAGQLSMLVNKRILKIERGRFNTIHRRFAQQFIEHAYFKAKDDTEELLAAIFDDPTNIQRINLLWSWLEPTTVNTYIRQWYRSLDLERWQLYVDAAAEHGLATLSSLAYKMYLIAPRGYLPLQHCFAHYSGKIARLVKSENKYPLYYLGKLVTALKNNCPEVILQAFAQLSPQSLAELIRNSEPELFHDYANLFWDLLQLNARFTLEVCTYLTEKDFFTIAGKVQKGDLDTLLAIVEFHRRFVEDMRVSVFKKYVGLCCTVLEGCGLADIHHQEVTNQSLLELPLFPDQLDRLWQSLDAAKIADDYAHGVPRHWGNFLALSLMDQQSGLKGISKIIDLIEPDALQRNVSRYYADYPYEFRLLLYQLCHASDEKRKKFAAVLFPFVKALLAAADKGDVQDVLAAFHRLDSEQGSVLATELGKPVPIPREQHDEYWPELKEKFRAVEASGEDYLLIPQKVTIDQVNTNK